MDEDRPTICHRPSRPNCSKGFLVSRVSSIHRLQLTSGSYDEARLALGLEDTVELPGQDFPRHDSHEGAPASAGGTSTGDVVTDNRILQENTLQGNSIYWSWSLDELFDVSPEDYQFSSGNES